MNKYDFVFIICIVYMSFSSCEGIKQPLSRSSSFVESSGFQGKEWVLRTGSQEVNSEASFRFRKQ